MTITLRDITSENWRTAVRLRVRPDQASFVAANSYSLAQSKFEPCWNTKGIYHDDTMVGFTMYGLNIVGDEWDGYWICRLMVDKAHQGQGYGRATMEMIVREIRESGYRGPVYISFEPNNTVAEQLYSSLGFVDTGKMIDEDSEKVFLLQME